VIERQLPLEVAAEAAGVSTRTAANGWRGSGARALLDWVDRPSVAHCIPGRTSDDRMAAIAALGRIRMTGREMAELLEMPPSTVSAVLQRIGLGKPRSLEALGLRHLRTQPPAPHQTAKPNGSSARSSAAGRTAPSTAPQQSAPQPSPAGSSTTIDTDHTAASTARRPSPYDGLAEVVAQGYGGLTRVSARIAEGASVGAICRARAARSESGRGAAARFVTLQT
jgi:hypothetical protein